MKPSRNPIGLAAEARDSAAVEGAAAAMTIADSHVNAASPAGNSLRVFGHSSFTYKIVLY